MLPGANTQAGNDIQNTRAAKPNPKDQVKPFEHRKDLSRRRTLLLIPPHFRIRKHGAEYRVMDQKEQNSEQCQACADEMEDRQQLQVVCVYLALVSEQGR